MCPLLHDDQIRDIKFSIDEKIEKLPEGERPWEKLKLRKESGDGW